MKLLRSCGVLLHPTAIPNKYGVGDLGAETYKFIDLLASLGQSYWQILPLTIPEKGNSPYSPLSSFAGNPLLISLDKLVKDGLLTSQDLENVSKYETKINFNPIIKKKNKLLRLAFTNFSPEDFYYHEFCKHQWLADYSLFITLYEKNERSPWSEWEESEKLATPEVKKQLRLLHQEEIAYHNFVQYIFYKQWQELKAYANSQQIQIIGDIPIYVSYNSADVWANKELFDLDENFKPESISGVPPDDFNADGQIWENPLYDWNKNRETSYQWWKERVAYNLHLTDVVRLDHFIGFTRYWSIPVELFDAKQGEWLPGPNSDLFTALEKSIPNLNIIAEDLGLITQEVINLKNQFEFPGMIVLHYALDEEEFTPQAYPQRTFIYTGTHDNNTTIGWWEEFAQQHERTKKNLHEYLQRIRHKQDIIIDADTIAFDLIELAYSSSCVVAMIPLQDMLELGSEYRMNRPGIAEGNWNLRLPQDYLGRINVEKVNKLRKRYDR